MARTKHSFAVLRKGISAIMPFVGSQQKYLYGMYLLKYQLDISMKNKWYLQVSPVYRGLTEVLYVAFISSYYAALLIQYIMFSLNMCGWQEVTNP